MKGSKALSRPGTATAEIGAIRDEKDRAIEERNDAREKVDSLMNTIDQ